MSFRAPLRAILFAALLLASACQRSTSSSSVADGATGRADVQFALDLDDADGDALAKGPDGASLSDADDATAGDGTGDASIEDAPSADLSDTNELDLETIVLGCTPPTPNDPNRQAAILLQGFEFQWLRTIAGFQTPHRISGIGVRFAELTQQLAATKWTLSGKANFLFSPGVDGDKANPRAYYAAVYGSALRTFRATVELAFSDDATDGDNPVAETRIDRYLYFEASCLGEPNGAPQDLALLLSGFSLRSSCDDAKQTNGELCNSNGFWPYGLHLGVSACAPFQSGFRCRLTLEIFRSWTPTNGGLKPFNDVLDYVVSIDVTALAGPTSGFRATPIALERQGTILEDVQTLSTTRVGATNLPIALLGMTGFGFQLIETGDLEKLGRYMTELTFGTTQNGYDPLLGELSFFYWMAFRAPVTVLQSDVVYEMTSTLLQFDATHKRSARDEVSGTICFSGFGFDCSNQGLPEQTEDSAPFVIETPLD
ncbi:MAG: hypothetical protein KC609_24820 [Myxococcales bacterium]|nr:hypothetical protein [Myxococcales bacterium]